MPISLSGSLNLSGSLTTTGTITATTLVVQTITSSISSITGSTNFGSLSSNTHQFTGSINASGSGNFSGSLIAQTGEFNSGGQEGSLGSVVRISTTNTNGNARNWGIVNTWDNYGDLTFRVSNAQGGNALTTGSTVLALLRTGVIDLPYGQIKFPATQNPSSDANTLDDYEEGTWTPTVGGSAGNPTVTYVAQIGKYVKIGRVVHIFCQLRLSASSGGSGNLLINGLPFTVSGDSDETGGSIGLALGFATLPTVLQPEASASYIFVMANQSNTPITDLDFTYLYFTLTYLV
jgi:hypothetical protein